MKCPYCGCHDVIGFSIVGPYVVGKGEVDLNKLPREIKYYCTKCKKGLPADKARKEREGAG